MPSKTKNPLAEAMRELKADPTPAARPVVRNDTCRKSEAQTGRGYADNSRTLRTSQFTSNSVYWPPRRGTRSKDCCRKP